MREIREKQTCFIGHRYSQWERSEVKTAFLTPDFLKKKRAGTSPEQGKLRSAPETLVSRHSVVFEGVTLSRGGTVILEKLDLRLSQKRIGLIGHNGSGKSTLVRALNGLILPDEGSVSVCGVNTAKQRKQLPGLVGFIFQNPDHQIIFPTVEEELAFGLEQMGWSKKQARDRVVRFMDLHGVQEWRDRPVHDLSEGQKQLVCVLSVLIMEPKILVLDEPFASLDLPTRLKMIRWIDRLPQQIIMVSHDLDSLTGYDRVLWLKDGRVHKDGAPEDVLSDYRQAALREAIAP